MEEAAEWKGYVKRALEDIDSGLKDLDEKVEDIRKCVNNNKVRIAAISGTVSLIVTLIVFLVKDMLAK